MECHRIFYLATCEDGVPYNRPFGAVILHEGRLVFCTGKDKRVYHQIQQNPKISICACKSGKRWLRLSATAYFFEDESAKRAMLELEDRLRNKYGPNAEGLALFSLKDATAVFSERGIPDQYVHF